MPVESVVLVHSPLLGPLSWKPTADELRRRGYSVVVPSLLDVIAAGPPWHQPVALAAASAAPDGAVLVVHSGAGALVPSIVEHAPGIAAVVFVDATLPRPGRSWADDAPADLLAHLDGLANADGVLPPWDEWFGPDAMTEMIADEYLLAAVTVGIPRLPMAFLREPAPDVDLPAELPRGYLRLSEAYDDVADAMAERGVPVRRLAGHHLSAVTDPGPVTDALGRVVAELGISAAGP